MYSIVCVHTPGCHTEHLHTWLKLGLSKQKRLFLPLVSHSQTVGTYWTTTCVLLKSTYHKNIRRHGQKEEFLGSSNPRRTSKLLRVHSFTGTTYLYYCPDPDRSPGCPMPLSPCSVVCQLWLVWASNGDRRTPCLMLCLKGHWENARR